MPEKRGCDVLTSGGGDCLHDEEDSDCGSSVSEYCTKSTVSCSPAHNEQRLVKVAEGPNNLNQKWQYRDAAPTNTPTRIKKKSKTPNEPKMHDNDKTCFTFQPVCFCPNSCATNDDRQMKMTDKETPHRRRVDGALEALTAVAGPHPQGFAIPL